MPDFSKLNLACGQSPMEGYCNVDKVAMEGVDLALDLEDFPWPFDSNSVEHIVCDQYVEHTPMETYGKKLVKAIQESETFEDLKVKVGKIDLGAPSDGLILFMEEVGRILKPGGVIDIATPYYTSDVCWRDPTHRRAITEVTFKYFDHQWRINSKLDHYGITTDLHLVHFYHDFYGDLNFGSIGEKTNALRYHNNVAYIIHVKLRKKTENETSGIRVGDLL